MQTHRYRRFQRINQHITTSEKGKRVFLVAWVTLCLGLSLILFSSVFRMYQSQQLLTKAQKRLETEEAKALELIQKLEEVDTPFFQEKIIRDELELQRPGETIIQLP